MIPKSSKFPLRTDFLCFRTRAKQLSTPHLRAMVADHTPTRLSVIVPLKVNKRAITRNWLKRLVYDQLYKALVPKNLDCVILFKPLTLLKNKQSKDLVIHELSQITDLL